MEETNNYLPTTVGNGEIAQASRLNSVSEQMRILRKLVQEQMVEGIDGDYAIIPGTKKKSLLKAGAEKICLLFNCRPVYKVDIRELGGDHREYIIICTLIQRGTNMELSSGVGSASTKERNFAKRREYYDDGTFEYVDNEYVADVYNNVLKIAKKRAFVDATVSTGAAGDLFTQDVGDPDSPHLSTEVKPVAAKAARKPVSRPSGASGSKKEFKPMTEEEAREMYAYAIPYSLKDAAKARKGAWFGDMKLWCFRTEQTDWKQHLTWEPAQEVSEDALPDSVASDEMPWNEE